MALSIFLFFIIILPIIAKTFTTELVYSHFGITFVFLEKKLSNLLALILLFIYVTINDQNYKIIYASSLIFAIIYLLFKITIRNTRNLRSIKKPYLTYSLLLFVLCIYLFHEQINNSFINLMFNQSTIFNCVVNFGIISIIRKKFLATK